MTTFGPLLRAWRNRRRLSQLDLALDANVSARHVSFLETGRARPSQPMVLTLAEALGIPREIRNQLLIAAGFAPVYTAHDRDDAALGPVRDAIRRIIERHDPYPAVVLDRVWRIEAMNRSARTLFGMAGLAEGASLLDQFAQPGLGAALIENWGEVGHHALRRLQNETAAAGGLDELDAAIAVLEADPDVAAFVPEPPLPPVTPTTYRSGAGRLSLFSTFAQFGGAEDIALSDLKIEMMFPADAETKAMLEGLAAQSA